jgi:hypothetical protein
MATGQQIRDYAKAQGFTPNAQGLYDVGDDNAAMRIYSHAQSQGYKGNELDEAFGWQAGTSDNWIKTRGLVGLTGPAATAAAPAPAPGAPATQPAAAPPPAFDVKSAAQTQAQQDNGMLGNWYQSYLKANPGVTSAASAAAGNMTVDPNTMTVEGRLQGLLDPNSPLMKAAVARGMLNANSLGVRNSGAGILAGQRAMYDTAVPIATSDAKMYGDAAAFNAREQGDTSRFNADQGNNWNRSMLDRFADVGKSERALAEEGRQADMGFNIEDRRLTQQDKQFLQTIGLETRKVDAQIKQFEQQYGLERDKLTADQRQFYDGLKLERDKLTQQADQFKSEWANRFSLAEFEKQGKLELAKMDADNRLALADIEASYKTDIGREQNISNAWGTMLTEIGKIQNNPELDADAKKTAITNATNAFQAYAKTWRVLTGGALNIDDLLNFGIVSSAPAPAPAPTTGPAGGDTAPGGGGAGGDGGG